MDDGSELPVAPAAQTSLHVRRAAAGDHGSLTWIISRLTPVLLELARYRVLSNLRAHCDPQDLVHDAWLVTLPRLADLQPRGGRLTPVLLRFLTSAMVLNVRNLARKHRRRGIVSGRAAAPVDEVAADQSGAVTRAMQAEVRDEVRRALAELPARDREVILLRGIEQHSTKTVATLLGVGEDAVAKRYQRALARLRERLPGSVFDEIDDE